MSCVLPVVEGQSEVESIPLLLRRLFERQQRYDIKVHPPIRVHRYKVVRPGEWENVIYTFGGECCAVLLLLDADDDYPAELGKDLISRAKGARPNVGCHVVIAKKELEAWLIAAIESLKGHRGIPSNVTIPPDPEAIRDAKRWLTEHMENRNYHEVTDQPALIAKFDIDLACRNSPSCDKFVRVVDAILKAITP